MTNTPFRSSTLIVRLAALVLLIMPLLGGVALAQDGYANGCDPSVGSGSDCYSLAVNYALDSRPPFPLDPARAEKLFQVDLEYQSNQCRAGNGLRCADWLRNVMLRPGIGLSAAQKADALAGLTQTLEAVCLAGDPYACSQRGNMPVDQGIWIAKTKTVAKARFDHLKASCAAGDATACADAGKLYIALLTRKRRQDDGQAALLLKGCLGASKGCDTLAALVRTYARGPDASKAIAADVLAAFATACATGDPATCGAYHDATSIRDPQKPARQETACAAGHADSCADRGRKTYHAYIKSGEPDANLLQSATTDFTRACDLGDQIACHTLEHISKG